MWGRLQYIIALALACSTSGWAQQSLSDTIRLEGVSVSRQKSRQPLQVGVKTITIDSLALREKKGMTLSELLLENSPVFIKTYGRGANATASIRGTGASHTNVYWNGIKVNSPMTGQADFSLVPLHFADDVAIHFGQASMGYGSGGLGGAVSIQSSPSWHKSFGAKLYQTLGSYQTYSTAASVSYGTSKIKAQTRVFWEQSENNFEYWNKARIGRPREVQHNADYSKYGALQELYIRPSSSSLISARVWYQASDRGIPKLMSSYSNDEFCRQDESSLRSLVEWRKTGTTSSWRVSSGLSNLQTSFIFSKTASDGTALPVINALSRSWSWLNSASWQKAVTRWLDASIIMEANTHWVNSHDKLTALGYKETQLHGAVRGNINVIPNDRISISALTAKEVFENQMTPLSYSLSSHYLILRSIQLKANVGVSRNIHHPSLNDLYWQPGGNSKLKPEDAKTLELGFECTHEKSTWKLNVDLNLYSSTIRNWIMWLPHLKDYWEPVNLNQVNTLGGEVSMTAIKQLGEFMLKARGSYSNTKSTIIDAGGVMRPDSQGKQLPFIPVHSGGIVLNAHWRMLYVAYTFTHFSERFTTTSNNPDSSRRLPPYYMSSLAVGKDVKILKATAGLQLRIDNLLNESYETIHWRPMPGRNYSLMLRVEL